MPLTYFARLNFHASIAAVAALCLGDVTADGQTIEPVEFPISLTARQQKLLRLAPDTAAATWKFDLDKCDNFTVSVDSPAAIDVSVSTPGGTLLKPNAVPAMWGSCTHLVGQGGTGGELLGLAFPSGNNHRITFQLKALELGKYGLTIEGIVGQETPVIAMMTSDSPLKVGTAENQPETWVGRHAPVTVAVFEGETAIKGASVSATIATMNGLILQAAAVDNGLMFDSATNDGLYTLDLVPTTFGPHFIKFIVTGNNLAGQPFVRHSAARVDVETPHAWFIRPPGITGTIIPSANGKIEALRLDATIGADSIRRVHTSFDVRLPSGRIVTVTSPSTEVPTASITSANFTASDLANLGEDGVSYVVAVTLFDETSRLTTPVDHLSPLNIALPAFAATNLDLPPIQFLDTPAPDHVIMDAAYDDDANTRYDRLKTWLPIRVLIGGQYRYSASLYDKCDYLIQTIYGTTTLQTGANQTLELEFAGRAIGYHGIDGEYYVKGAVLHNATASAMQPYPYLTRQWSVPLFENFYACADRNQNGECDRCDIYRNPSLDANGNGILDSRETCALIDLTGDAGLPSGPDGNVTMADYFAFLEAYAAGSLIADITGVGGVPDGQVNMLDFNAFMNMWQSCHLDTIGGGGTPGGQP